MNAPRIWIIIIFVITSMNTLLGQSIIKLPNGKYASEGKELTMYELGKLLSNDLGANSLYKQYGSQVRKSRRQFNGGLLLFLGGSALTLHGISGAIGQRNDNAEILVLLGLAGTATGLGFVVASAFSKKHLLTKAVSTYNENLSNTEMKETLMIGTTSNGLGLVYNF